jgi:hypothetical protein
MSSSVDIANQALLMLGAAPVVSFDDGTVEAGALQVIYEPAKKQVLRSYPWRCATRTETLAQLVDQPVDPRWDFQFSIPDKCLRVLDVVIADNKFGRNLAWTIEGKRVLANFENIAANYILDIEEPEMDVHVEMAVAAKVAADLSYTLTASNSRVGDLHTLYEQKLNEARTTDRQEASHKVFNIDQLAYVRR